MQIEIEVVGGSSKLVRSKLSINSSQVGELNIDRSDFTKLCDLLYHKGYKINGKSQSFVENLTT